MSFSYGVDTISLQYSSDAFEDVKRVHPVYFEVRSGSVGFFAVFLQHVQGAKNGRVQAYPVLHIMPQFGLTRVDTTIAQKRLHIASKC